MVTNKDPSSEPLPVKASDSPSTIQEYFETRESKASARIYRNIASDPVVSEVARRKKLNYREMLLVVGGVVGALDDRIEELEARDGKWRRLDIPIFSSGQSEPEPSTSAPNGGTPSSESEWILKYLTLRNVLGVLLVVVTLSAGFFAWWNKDYRSLIKAAEGRSTAAAAELLESKAKLREFQSEFNAKQIEVTRLEGLLGAADDEKSDLRDRIRDLELARDQQASQATAQTVDLAKELGDAKAEASALRSQLTGAKAEMSRWRSLAGSHEKTATTRSTELSDAEAKASKATSEKDKAVDAWNQLVWFLGQNKEGTWGGKIEVDTKEVKQQLSELERYTKAVTGMRRELP